MSKNGNRKRKRRRSGRREKQGSPGWHLKLEEFRREAKAKSPEVVSRADMRGWELHLSHKPHHHQCSSCAWSGMRVYPVEEPTPTCPDCASEIVNEPWALTAHPCREHNDYTWLGKAAEFLGAPAEDKPEHPGKGIKTVVSFSWAEAVTVSPLEGM